MNGHKWRFLNLILIAVLGISSAGCQHNRLSSKDSDSISVTGEIDDSYINPPKKQEFIVPKEVTEAFAASPGTHSKADLRKFPYPFKAMLALCSDIDNTTLEEFKAYHRFLNTNAQTPYGEGLGFDVGDSMWMYMGSNFPEATDEKNSGLDKVMTYFIGLDSSKYHYAEEIKKYYKAGWIDALHTYGDFSRVNINNISFNRQFALDAWKELNSKDLKFKVWINHGNEGNKQNFGCYQNGSFYHYQEGDDPKSKYYHDDLVLQNGIKFIWNSKSESEFGTDNPLYPINLRDGKKIWGFHRYTNDVINNKIDWTWTPKFLNKQITKDRLDKLIEKQQFSIVTQHLGVSSKELYSPKNIEALKLLKDYKERGHIIIARTSRLLNYALMYNNIQYSIVQSEGKTWINIQSISDPLFGSYTPELEDIRGITFYTDTPDKTFLFLNQKLIVPNLIERNPADSSGRASISVKWFSASTKDYTEEAQ